MAELLERIKLSNLVHGDGIVENFKNNSLFFYNAYSKSDDNIMNIPIGKIQLGGFYFLHYMDDSNWMKYSPIFTIDFKKFENLIIIHGVNFNFIPLEVRAAIFDKFIIEEDFENDRLLKVTYEGMYRELLKYGFEYAIVEYNMAQVKAVHKISMSMVPRFLYSQHPINKYDPKKLYEIWEAKIGEQGERHKEMSKSLIDDFFTASDDILDNYKVLKNHILRIQKSLDKYGQ
jgi:hypothetical protein